MLEAINDQTRHVELEATPDDQRSYVEKDGIGSYLLPGGYDGSIIVPELNLKGCGKHKSIPTTHTIGIQKVNIKAARVISGQIGESVGETIMHEINESYIGTRLDPGGNYDSGRDKSHRASELLDTHKSSHVKVGGLRNGGAGVINMNTGLIIKIWD